MTEKYILYVFGYGIELPKRTLRVNWCHGSQESGFIVLTDIREYTSWWGFIRIDIIVMEALCLLLLEAETHYKLYSAQKKHLTVRFYLQHTDINYRVYQILLGKDILGKN